ncbi:unnamed protein product [Mytilus coruscus]|uniref:Uncharacterized protein n=1 Tax=Mytilus coruscus TaxID=42192 RepID=A0A6J8DVT5_MYTCO|nr:unnamed protein product [Mytilus coruscus]
MRSYFGYRQLIRDTQTHNCACLPNGVDQIQERDIQYCLDSTHFFLYTGTRQKSTFTAFKWGIDYYSSLDYYMKRNALLPSSNFCQKIDTQSSLKGVISCTNVFREEIEMIKMKDFDEQPQRCFSGIFIPVKGHTILNMTEQECNGHNTFYICKTSKFI